MSEPLQTTNFKTEFYKNIFPDAEFCENNEVKVFTGFDEEYYSLTKGVAVRDLSASSILNLKGESTPDFINRISTNEVAKLEDGKTIRTLFTNEKGRIIDRTTLINLGAGEFLLVGSPAYREKLHSWIQNYIYLESIEKTDVSDEYLLLEISGPQANSYLTIICGNLVDKVDNNSLVSCNTDGFIFDLFKLKNIRQQEKYWLMINYERAEDFIKFMIDKKLVFDLSFVGPDAYNSFRAELGIPAAPNEINTHYNPHEIGLIEEVSFNKGCYIGQEVIARLDTYDKIQKFLCGLVFEQAPDELPAETLSIVDSSANDAGKLTTVANSKKLKKVIGLGIIKKNYVNNESDLFVKISDEIKIPVKITKLPFEK